MKFLRPSYQRYTLVCQSACALLKPAISGGQAINAGLLKVMAKMGISTLQSYKGAQVWPLPA